MLPGERRDPIASHKSLPEVGDEVIVPPRTPASFGEPWRLLSPDLPIAEHVRLLIEHYFVNVHPLRCHAFVHKPTFLQKLETDPADKTAVSPLIYAMCALGAQFYTLEVATNADSKQILNSGSQWARSAQRLVLDSIDRISIENLMATVLLHDYALRMANFTNAFMLCGLASRMSQALQINLEYSTNILCEDSYSGPSVMVRESRRRLMWSCWAADALVGSGVDQLTTLDLKDVKIQLPCNNRNFLHQLPCITETMEVGRVLLFAERMPVTQPSQNLGIAAYYLRHIRTRQRVLRYIKRLQGAEPPWMPNSEFRQLEREGREWYDSLPPSLHFTHGAISIRKESSQLGALCLLHCAYHQTMCDLLRLGAPALYKLRGAFVFPPEQHEFLRYLQRELLRNAMSLATITAETSRHGARMLADTWLPTIIYDSSRIMLYHVTQLVDPGAKDLHLILNEIFPLVRQNIATLEMMQPLHAIADSLAKAAEKMLEKASSDPSAIHARITTDLSEKEDEEESPPGTPVQAAPDYMLNPLTIYRMARNRIAEKHAPERIAHPPPKGAPSLNSVDSSGSLRSHAPRIDRDLSNLEQNIGQSLPQTIPTGGTLLPAMDTADQHDPSGLAAMQPHLMDSELHGLLTSELGWTWQNADTLVGSNAQFTGSGIASGPIADDGVLARLPWAPSQFQANAGHGSFLTVDPPEVTLLQQAYMASQETWPGSQTN